MVSDILVLSYDWEYDYDCFYFEQMFQDKGFLSCTHVT